MKLLPPMEFQNSQLGPTTNNYKNINRVGGKAYNSAYTGCSSNQTTEQSQAKRSNKEIYLYQHGYKIQSQPCFLTGNLSTWQITDMHCGGTWHVSSAQHTWTWRGWREHTLHGARTTSFIPCLHFPVSLTPSGMN